MLNVIKFARLISYVTDFAKTNLSISQIECIQACVEDIVDQPRDTTMTTNQIRIEIYNLFDALNNGRKIEAIKVHRMLTGYGLKESKDAVEKLIVDCQTKFNSDTTYKA